MNLKDRYVEKRLIIDINGIKAYSRAGACSLSKHRNENSIFANKSRRNLVNELKSRC